MSTNNFARQEGEATNRWLERLISYGAPADIRADVRAILESESQPQSEVRSNEDLINKIEKVIKRNNRPILSTLNAICSAKPNSTAEARSSHQKDFKASLIVRYGCAHASDPTLTRCIVLNNYFSSHMVIASHIIALNERNLCAVLGISDVWDERNGLLLYKHIDDEFENMRLTFLPNPATSTISVRILYDGLVMKPISGVSKLMLGLEGIGEATFGDLHNRNLVLPELTFPFRRGLARHAKSAYEIALTSHVSHTIAENSAPSEEQWFALWEYCKEVSPDCSNCTFFNEGSDNSDNGDNED